MRLLLFLIFGAIIVVVLLFLRYPVKVAKRRRIEDIWFVDLMAAIGILFFPAWLFALWYAHVAKGKPPAARPRATVIPSMPSTQPSTPPHITNDMDITD